MSGFQRKWTDAQRNAIIGEVFDNGRKIPPVLEDARRGKLPAQQGDGGLPPFDMPYGTAQEYVKQEKARRRPDLSRHASGDSRAFRAEVVERLAALLDRKLRKLEEPRSKLDLSEAEAAARLAERIDKLSRELPPPPDPSNGNGAQQAEPTEPTGSGLVAQMVGDQGEDQAEQGEEAGHSDAEGEGQRGATSRAHEFAAAGATAGAHT